MLLSHPDKSLQQHVAEVAQASVAIMSEHSPKVRQLELSNWVTLAVAFHDVGKGTAAFQKYIRDTNNYRDPKKSKAHTPFSFLAVLTAGKTNWIPEQLLAVGNAALGHHSCFKSRNELSSYLWDSDWSKILVKQANSVNWGDIAESVRFPVAPFNANDESLLELAEWLEEDVFQGWIDKLSLPAGIRIRLQSQFVLSVLLEADKAFLKIDELERSLYRTSRSPSFAVSNIDNYTQAKVVTPLSRLREAAVEDLFNAMQRVENPLQVMTLPTGTGKTLLAARWAFHQRSQLSRDGFSPKIIIVLPFLSVIDQTNREYCQLLAQSGLRIVPYHSLSERYRDDTESEEVAEFLIDTWHGDVVITTFDQFLLAAFDARSKNQMRFHNLCDAIVVMDEVQALPTALWDLLDHTLRGLTSIGEFRLLAMSATQPGFLSDATELIVDHERYYRGLDRYELILRHDMEMPIEDFIEEMRSRAEAWRGERVMIVLNTRKSARRVRDALVNSQNPVLFLSADVTPVDRMAAIESIKKGTPCLVVATQCVEAGVDIDLGLVIRDFGPLDSIVQVAGRCNRNGKKPRCKVELVSLIDDRGRKLSSYVYDPILLQETRTALNDTRKHGDSEATIQEKDILALTKRYFAAVAEKKDTGAEFTKQFATWDGDFPDPLQLLRGKKQKQVQFVVVEKDAQLRHELEKIRLLTDRWERKRALRHLSPRLAAVTVSIYAKSEWKPEDFSDLDATGNFHLLHEGYYSSERGLDLEAPGLDDEENPASWGMML
jgi:CRISPR-associated endonuclease/helicase Cas3